MPTTLGGVPPEPQELDPASWLIAGGRPHGPGQPLSHPITPASTFEHGGDRIYSRADATETWDALETLLGGLEHAQSLVFASGMAAVAAVFDQLEAGARVLLPDDCYHGVAQTAKDWAAKGRIRFDRLPADDTAAWQERMTGADLIWLESPTNPLLSIADLTTLCRAERKTGSILVVDNTFLTPLRQQPLDLGADITMQSTTKFIGGHSDLLGGSLATRDQHLVDRLRTSRTLLGASPGALEVFLTLRGARTLALRVDTAESNAKELAAHLGNHPDVSTVRYPGLGSMISFDALDADRAAAACRSVRVVRHATSLGGVESTMERRAGTPGQEHLPAGLIRLSVGCEAIIDLWADLDQALRS